MVAHLFQICASSLPSLNAFFLSSKSLILSPLSLVKIFSPLTTVIRLLLYLLPYLSISPISHFGIILTLWLFFIPIMHSSLLQDHSFKPKLQRFLYGICYERSLQSFQHSLSVLNDPIRTAQYYTLVGKDSSALPQPQIPSGLTCTCRRLPRSPIIDQEGRHFTTGCPSRVVRQASSNSIIQRLLYILHS
jgi:hypothetical protein